MDIPCFKTDYTQKHLRNKSDRKEQWVRYTERLDRTQNDTVIFKVKMQCHKRTKWAKLEYLKSNYSFNRKNK